MSSDLGDLLKQMLVGIAIAVLILATAIAAALAGVDREEPVRWFTGLALVIGGGLGFSAMIRNVGEGPRLPALLAVSIIAHAATVLGGLGFLGVGLSEFANHSEVTITPSFLIIMSYGCFGAFSTAILFLGVFLHIGYRRRWLAKDVQKAFWRINGG